MKIIFLDIDGVLNCARSCAVYKRGHGAFDPVGVKLINKLREMSGAEIVLSSSWRKLPRKIKEAERLLRKGGFPKKFRFLDKTPETGLARGYDIRAWFGRYRDSRITHYCIIDDDIDILRAQLPHFVQTSQQDGFTYRNFWDAQRILECGTFSNVLPL